MSEVKLYFFCGKMAAGKSTLAKELSHKNNAVLLSEDHWLKILYPEEIRNLSDYIKYSSRIKSVLKSHVSDILKSGISAVMDFPANTKGQRQWFRSIINELGVKHELHYIKASNEVCLRQLKERSQNLPEGTFFTTESEFIEITEYFTPPVEEESFHIILHNRE